MLTGGQFYDVLCAVVPLYVALALGYGSLRWWGVVTPEQGAGISRCNALVAMPALVFEVIAFNDPYTMNDSLIAAYCASNGALLVALFAWAWCAKRADALDWAITLFQAAAMPNTIIVGIPTLSPLYSVTGPGIAAIFIGQVLWLYPVLLLYELRAVKNLNSPAQTPSPSPTPEPEHEECRIPVEDGAHREPSPHTTLASSSPPSLPMKKKDMALRVAKKMVCLPLTYSTLLGIIYSLIASRWDFGPPRILRDSLDIIGRITLGLTMYTIGLFMAGQERLVTSWWVASLGAFCRFVVGPGVMGLAAFLLGLRGDTLRFAILQAALPQAVISFVFARDYDLHTDVFTTAVSLQTIIFMPIVLAYYMLLEL